MMKEKKKLFECGKSTNNLIKFEYIIRSYGYIRNETSENVMMNIESEWREKWKKKTVLRVEPNMHRECFQRIWCIFFVVASYFYMPFKFCASSCINATMYVWYEIDSKREREKKKKGRVDVKARDSFHFISMSCIIHFAFIRVPL